MSAFLQKYGWKTLAGTILLALGQVASSWPVLAPYKSILDAVGIALGGIGIIHKAAKIEDAVDTVEADMEKPHA